MKIITAGSAGKGDRIENVIAAPALDHPKLINQLVGLERRVARGGKDSIDHAPGGHDDIANVVAGLAEINSQYGGYSLDAFSSETDADEDRAGAA